MQPISQSMSSEDDELWEDLIALSLKNPTYVGELLEHVGGRVDPLRLIRRVPDGMVIAGLRDRLVKIIADYALQCRLRQGCNQILKSDCVALFQRLYHTQTSGFSIDPKASRCAICMVAVESVAQHNAASAAVATRSRAADDDTSATSATAATTSTSTAMTATMAKKGADGVSVVAAPASNNTEGSKGIIVFWCGHIYHHACLRQQQHAASGAQPAAATAAAAARGNSKVVVQQPTRKEHCPNCKSVKDSRRQQRQQQKK